MKTLIAGHHCWGYPLAFVPARMPAAAHDDKEKGGITTGHAAASQRRQSMEVSRWNFRYQIR